MAHQDVPNTIRAEVQFTMGGNNASNVFHVLANARPTQQTLDDLRSIIQSWVQGYWDEISSSAWTCTNIILTDLTDLTGLRSTFVENDPGVVNADAMPANATIAVKADTGTRGRGKNGRVFWIGLAETQVAGNTVSTVAAEAIVAALEQLRELVEAAPDLVGLCIPHFVVGGIRPPVVQVSMVRGFAMANNLIDSQKLRLPEHKKRKRHAAP